MRCAMVGCYLSALVLGTDTVGGQAHPAVSPTVSEAAEAVLKWYASNYRGEALVISPRSSNVALRDGAIHQVQPESLGFSPEWAEQVGRRMAASVEICGEFNQDLGTDGLCNVDHPWVWLLFSRPVPKGSGAARLIVLQLRLLMGPEGQTSREAVHVEFTITRAGATWRAEVAH